MDVGITELEKIEATRVDGVETPANGIPILLLKSAAPAPAPDADGAEKSAAEIAAKAVTDGQVDEQPDISLGQQIMTLLGHAIGNEAQEIAAGSYGETRDVSMLTRAADIVSCWCAREQAVADGKDPDASCGCCDWCEGMGCGCCPSCGSGALMCSAAAKADMSTASINDLPDSAFAYIEPGGSKDEDGKTTPRSLRHFPVHDAAHVRNALARAPQSPFGEKAMPKIRAAAKREGIEVSDTSKSQIAKEGADVDTETQTGDLTEVVKAAVTEAAAPLLKRVDDLESSNKALAEELAKVKATPVPGGLVLSRNVQVKQPGAAVNEDYAAKAALYRAKAGAATSPQDRDGYLALARETEQRAKTPS